jgi:hypothetical protein
LRRHSEVAGAVDAGVDLAVAANGGAEVGSEVVGGEEMVLGARAGEVDVDTTRAASGGKEGSPGGVGSEETVLGAGAGAE